MVTAGELSSTGERVRAELSAMGFSIVLDAEGSTEPTRDTLAEVAEARDAVAAVALIFSREGVELWVVESAKRETRLRRFVSAEHARAESANAESASAESASAGSGNAEPANADPTLALRTAELLRATLLAVSAERAVAVDVAAAEPRKPAEPGEPAAQTASEPPLTTALAASAASAAAAPAAPVDPDFSRALSLRLGTGLVWSAGGLGTFPGLELAAQWWLTKRLGVELAAIVPLARMAEQSPEGSSSTRVAALSLAIAASLPLGNPDWVWDIGGGIAGLALQTKGTPASTAYVQEENVGVAVAPLLRSGLGYAFTRRLRLRLGACLGVSVPRFVVVHAGTTAATWGLPFASAELALEVDVL
jgi:hypothetical protein